MDHHHLRFFWFSCFFFLVFERPVHAMPSHQTKAWWCRERWYGKCANLCTMSQFMCFLLRCVVCSLSLSLFRRSICHFYFWSAPLHAPTALRWLPSIASLQDRISRVKRSPGVVLLPRMSSCVETAKLFKHACRGQCHSHMGQRISKMDAFDVFWQTFSRVHNWNMEMHHEAFYLRWHVWSEFCTTGFLSYDCRKLAQLQTQNEKLIIWNQKRLKKRLFPLLYQDSKVTKKWLFEPQKSLLSHFEDQPVTFSHFLVTSESA